MPRSGVASAGIGIGTPKEWWLGSGILFCQLTAFDPSRLDLDHLLGVLQRPGVSVLADNTAVAVNRRPFGGA